MSKIKRLVLLAFFISTISLAAASIYVINKRASIYPYEVAQNYEYNFSKSKATIHKLTFHAGKVIIPDLDLRNQSVFMRMAVRTSFMGKYFEPSLTLATEKSSLIQYFERGAEGIRYINISSLLSEKETSVKFIGKYLSIDDQAVQVFAFRNEIPDKTKLLVIAPHPDDAEIAAFGLYSTYDNAFIVTVTAGDAGGNKYDEIYRNRAEQYLNKGRVRTWNSLTVPLLGGISPEQTINLGFFDGTLKAMYQNKASVAEGLYTHTTDITTFRKQNVSKLNIGLNGRSDWNSLVGNFEYLLKKIQPDIIVTPYPALDKHSDHQFASIALFEAIKESGMKEGDLYLYTNHFVLNEYYPYGRMGGIVSLPASFGKSLYFDSIYSHPLTPEKQNLKIFALEAMNDLRPDTEWRFTEGILRMAVSKIRKDILGKDKSYYRRAVRSNELFFVTEIHNIYDNQKLKRIIGATNL